MNQGEALMTPQQAADYLGFTKRFLEARRYRGGGPAYVAVGRRAVRYRKCDLDEWVAARVRSSTADDGSEAA